jgi:hypothetical protein
MKKSIILAAYFLCISAASFALDTELGKTSSFKIVPKADKKYDLYYVSESDAPVTISIYDDEGTLITNDKIKNNRSFKRTYNFKNMASGDYKVVVKNEEGRGSQQVFHNPKTSGLQTMISQVPNSKSFKVLVGEFDSAEPVIVKGYNSDNRLIFKDEIQEVQGFSKMYNLSNITGDMVRFTVENGRESVTQVRSLN